MMSRIYVKFIFNQEENTKNDVNTVFLNKIINSNSIEKKRQKNLLKWCETKALKRQQKSSNDGNPSYKIEWQLNIYWSDVSELKSVLDVVIRILIHWNKEHISNFNLFLGKEKKRKKIVSAINISLAYTLFLYHHHISFTTFVKHREI